MRTGQLSSSDWRSCNPGSLLGLQEAPEQGKAGFLTDYNGRSQSQLTIIISLSEIYFWELALARVLDLGEDICLDLLHYWLIDW